jgi:hypothetical protein
MWHESLGDGTNKLLNVRIFYRFEILVTAMLWSSAVSGFHWTYILLHPVLGLLNALYVVIEILHTLFVKVACISSCLLLVPGVSAWIQHRNALEHCHHCITSECLTGQLHCKKRLAECAYVWVKQAGRFLCFNSHMLKGSRKIGPNSTQDKRRQNCCYKRVDPIYQYRCILRIRWHARVRTHTHACVGIFLFGWRAPQRMLWTHHSLEAYCATLCRRWLWRW